MFTHHGDFRYIHSLPGLTFDEVISADAPIFENIEMRMRHRIDGRVLRRRTANGERTALPYGIFAICSRYTTSAGKRL